MKITGLHVDNYGILHDLTITRGELEGVPAVIFGPNEAGKSTLMSFIRGVFFGFKAAGNKTRPVHEGPAGGWIHVENQTGEAFRVHRSGKGEGRVTVEMPGGTREGEAFLKANILYGISPVLFRNIFAIGIDELRKLEELKKEEVSAQIYGAATGISPDRLAAAGNHLYSASRELYNPRGRKPEINRLLKSMQELDRRIKDLQQQPSRYLKLQEELAGIEEKQDHLLQQREELQQRKSRLDNLLKARSHWLEVQSLLGGQPEPRAVQDFPRDGVSRLEKLKERQAIKSREVKKYSTQIDGLQEKVKELHINEKVAAWRPQVKEISGEKTLFLEKRQKLAEEEARVKQLEKQAGEHLASLGPGWSEEDVLALDLSLELYRSVEKFERRFQKYREKMGEARQGMEYHERNIKDYANKLQEVQNKLSEYKVEEKHLLSVEERAVVLEELNSIMQEYNTLQAGKNGVDRRLQDLEERKVQVKQEKDNIPEYNQTGWLTGAAAVFGGAGLVIIGINPAGIAVFAGGLLLAVLVYWSMKKIGAGNKARREQLKNELEKLDRSLEQARGEVKNMAERLHKVEGQKQHLAARLEMHGEITAASLSQLRLQLDREKESKIHASQLAQTRAQVEQDLQQARQLLQAAQAREEEYKGKIQELHGEWQAWCTEKNLPALEARDMAAFLNLAVKARDNISELRLSRDRSSQVREFVDGYVTRVNEVAKALELEPACRDNAGEHASRLEELLGEHDQAWSEKEHLEEKIKEACAEKEALEWELEDIKEEVNHLLEVGKAETEEEFRKKAMVFQKQEQILTIAGSLEELPEIYAELSCTTGAENARERELVDKELSEIDEQIKQLGNEAAERKLQLKEMENSEELGRALQEKEMLKERLAGKARQWRVLTLCSTLLNMAREKHERERQPAVLKQASTYIKPMTRGRYTRVIAPLGTPEQLEVEKPQGERVQAPNLSRGAANQLYLSLRLALAGHYSSLVGPLPVVLDDVMVDFDPERLAGAVEVLKEIARERQVLLFTCHEHVKDAIAEAAPEHKCLYL